MSSKEGVKNALWSSAGYSHSSPQGGALPVVLVRGKVSTWRGIKKALWHSAGHLSITEERGRVVRGEVGVELKLENGHSSPLMVTTALLTLTHSQGSQTHTGDTGRGGREKCRIQFIPV